MKKKRSWFGGKADVDDLVARGKFGAAIRELEKRLEEQPDSTTHRQRLGDILGRAGRTDEAIEVLGPLVDRYVGDGSSAKAIAVVKKIQRLDPGHEATTALLTKIREVGDPAIARSVPGDGAPVVPQSFVPAYLENDSVEIAPFRDDAERPTATSEFDAGWRDRVDNDMKDFGWSPLLEGLPADVFDKVVGRLRLLVKNPGAIICAEGEPAPSLFVLARGFARVYRRSPDGRQRQVMVLEEGRYFGEEALLESGAARPVTVTAASECELLEIDLHELTVILSANPKARARLERTHAQRPWTR